MKWIISQYKLDQEVTLKLLETVESLGNTPIIFGTAFAKEGLLTSQDKVLDTKRI